MTSLRALLLTLGMLLAMAGTPAYAISLKEAIQQVETETGGKVLSADTIRTGGNVIYRIKVLMTDGRVRVFHITA